MKDQYRNFESQVKKEIEETLSGINSIPDKILLSFLEKKLFYVVKEHLSKFGYTFEQVSHIDFPDLVGDLILKYYTLDENYQQVKKVDNNDSKRNYMYTSLTRETKRLIIKNIRYMIKKPLTQSEQEAGMSLKDKLPLANPEKEYAEKHASKKPTK